MKLPRPTVPIFSGLALIVVGFGYDLLFAGLPYQDPPPDLYASWRFHARIAGTIQGLGALSVVVGLVLATAIVASRLVSRSREP